MAVRLCKYLFGYIILEKSEEHQIRLINEACHTNYKSYDCVLKALSKKISKGVTTKNQLRDAFIYRDATMFCRKLPMKGLHLRLVDQEPHRLILAVDFNAYISVQVRKIIKSGIDGHLNLTYMECAPEGLYIGKYYMDHEGSILGKLDKIQYDCEEEYTAILAQYLGYEAATLEYNYQMDYIKKHNIDD